VITAVDDNYLLFQEGKADVVANDAGDRVTPSMVSFSSEEIVSIKQFHSQVNGIIIFIPFQSVGLPAKQGLFRNTSNTVVQCKEFLIWNKDEEEELLPKLQALSVCPVIVKNGKLFYEVEMNEKTKQISPEEVLIHIYRKLYGSIAKN
jgi:molecular chaperone DnaK (HSP70)